MKTNIKIHPLNAKGKYYVDQETCIVHGVCEIDAPDNFTLIDNHDGDFGAYVFKQPENAREESDCKRAMSVCPVFAIHDDGE